MTVRTLDASALIRGAAPVIAQALDGVPGDHLPSIPRADRLAFVERGRVSPALRERFESAYRNESLRELRAVATISDFIARLREEARRDWAARGAPL